MSAAMLSRRGALAAAAASPFALSGVGVVRPSGALARAGSHDDADAVLLAHCEAYMALERFIEGHPAGDMMVVPDAIEAEQDRLCSDLHDMRGPIAEMRATTMTGLLAKARVTMGAMGYVVPPDLDGENGLAWSLCADLLRMGADA